MNKRAWYCDQCDRLQTEEPTVDAKRGVFPDCSLIKMDKVFPCPWREVVVHDA